MAEIVRRDHSGGRQPAISVVLPTMRPTGARACLERLARTSVGVDYEVVVVSPLDMAQGLAGVSGYDRLVFVTEDEKRGSCYANSLGWKHARGTYVFAIADDHWLGSGCLQNLIDFMRPHDEEMFLAGARCYGPEGAGLEGLVYDKYYAFNPCIRRDVVERVGGFYDTCFRSYWGDPDLACRVWFHGGRVELCRTAWVEFHNELDTVAAASVRDYAQTDYETFVRRWHPRYGQRVRSSDFAAINCHRALPAPGVPPEKAARLTVFLHNKDWTAAEEELRRATTLVSPPHLPTLMATVIGEATEMPPSMLARLALWLADQLDPAPPLRPLRAGERPAKWREAWLEWLALQERQPSPILKKAPRPGDRLRHEILAHWLLPQDRHPSSICGHYDGFNIISAFDRVYVWPEERPFGDGLSTPGRPEDIPEDPRAASFDTIHEAVAHIEGQRQRAGQANALVDPSELSAIEAAVGGRRTLDERWKAFLAVGQPPDELSLALAAAVTAADWVGLEKIASAPSELFLDGALASRLYDYLLARKETVPADRLSPLAFVIAFIIGATGLDAVQLSDLYRKELVAAPPGPRPTLTPVLAERNFRGHDIFAFAGAHFAVPTIAAEFNPVLALEGRYLRAREPNWLKHLILAQQKTISEKRRSNQALRLAYRTLWYAWRGRTDAAGAVRRFGLPKVEAGGDAQDIVGDPENYGVEATYRDRQVSYIAKGYRGHDIMHVAEFDRYYAWPQDAGRFDLRAVHDGTRPTAVEATTVIGIKAALDDVLGPPSPADERACDWARLARKEARRTAPRRGAAA